MHLENILLQKEQPLAVVSVNRPKVLNALNHKTLEELECVFFDLKNDSSVKVVILTGSGDKAFVAGADINEIAALNAEEGARFARRGQAVLDLIEGLGKPVIAAINGYALGGGLEIAMACTLRLASSGAELGQPEINLGVIPGFGGTQRLARLIGEGRCMELVLVSEPMDAERAYGMGLINKVVEPEHLMELARDWARKLCSKSSLILSYAMESVHRGLQGCLSEGLNLEAKLFGLCCASQDKQEGTRAFLEKRKPSFTNG